jgi:hypothetical protein
MTQQATQLGAGGRGDSGTALLESELLESQLARLRNIEGCLRAMESALVSRNLELLENATARLTRCHAELETVPPIAGSGAAPDSTSGTRRLREAQWRILHLGRVLAALLVRRQRALAAIANLLAGRSASYGPPAVDGTLALVLEDHTGDYRCRV